jgi:hypothetical protein
VLESPDVGGVVQIVEEQREEDTAVPDSVSAREIVYLELHKEIGRENWCPGSLDSQPVGEGVRDPVSTSDVMGEDLSKSASSSSFIYSFVSKLALCFRRIAFESRPRLDNRDRLSIRYCFPFRSRL